jgi:class 3 adenylate cyclase/tetratricopeptide (TPR) repeat protein
LVSRLVIIATEIGGGSMRCSSCQHENRPEAHYCGACGHTLLVMCAACGIRNSPANRFCDACGGEMPGAPALEASRSVPRAYTPAHLAHKILTSRSALEGERKQVTVLFCDMANSTELAQRLGAEAMHQLLNAFFELALAEVHRLEGTINQFLGDGFMALFGAPVAHEDHVRRALLSALAIRQRLNDPPAGSPEALSRVRVRMGLNTGTVVVGKIGDNLRMDYTAVGDTTNLAARLQHLAQPGLICVSPSVHAAGQAYFEFRPIGKHALKGIREPVSVHELARARPREEGESRAKTLGIGSLLVGRDAELAVLRTELDGLIRGTGGILVVSGEPGAGKSRLLAEIRKLSGMPDPLWLEGRAVSFGRSLSYWPFIEILKKCFHIEDDDLEDESWRKLEQGLNSLFAERTSEMLPYLATVLALAVPSKYEDRVKYLDGQGLRRQVFRCMRQLFEQLALRQPLVLLLEDWHWADRSSIELAEHLLPLADATPLLGCFVTRPDPEGPAARIRQFASERPGSRFQEVMLAPLSQEHSTALVANLVGTRELPVSLREQILRKTEGNPFFIEEVIRSLVTDGSLVRSSRGDAWQLVKRVEQVNLPDTIEGLLLARIDRLEEEVKQALKLASVIGRSFFHRVLNAISEAQRSLDGCLAHLEHAELIRVRQQLPEVEYIFKHALVQEAAYGSILAERRRAIHRRVAQAIELLFEDRLDEFTSLLAYHYTRAEDWEKAQEYLFKAGDQAGRMAADVEALEHFRQAEAAYLKAFGDKLTPLQRASLARKVGAALYGTGHYERAHEQFRRALLQVGIHYPDSRWGVRRTILKYLAGHLVRHVRKRASKRSERDMDPALAQEISTVCHHMSWMDYFFDEERMVLDSLLELHVGERSHYSLAEARGLSSVGFGLMEFNARRLARRYHTEAIAVAQRTENPSAIAFAWFTLGFLDFYDGVWDEGESILGKAAAAYRKAGDIHGWGGATLILSFVTYFRGKLALAAELTAELVRAGEDAGEPQVASWGLQNIAYPGLACGPLDEVAVQLRKGKALAAKIPAWQNLVYQYALLGKCHVLQGDLDEASAVLAEVGRIMQVRNMCRAFDRVEFFTALASAKLASAERLEGDPQRAAMREARRASGQALRYARRMRGWLPEALRLHGTSEWLCGKRAAAHKRWRESIALAEAFAFPIERARTLLEVGHRTGDSALVEGAVDTFRQSGANVFLAFALHSLARLHSRSPSAAPSVMQSYANAIAALEAVNATHELSVARTEYARLQKEAICTDCEKQEQEFVADTTLSQQITARSASA